MNVEDRTLALILYISVIKATDLTLLKLLIVHNTVSLELNYLYGPSVPTCQEFGEVGFRGCNTWKKVSFKFCAGKMASRSGARLQHLHF